VYNLHVNGIDTQTDDSYGIGHNYYVNDILVHNKVVNPYSCFVAGTKVTMADGTEKNIEDVQVGEKVVIYDELIGAKFTSPVTMTLHHPSASQDIYTITLDDGTVLKPNQDHPLYEAGTKTYVTTPAFADAFHNGKNPLLQKLDGSIHSVSTITKKGMSVPTYNLHVAGIDNNPNMVSVAGIGHNYYANGILVHNNMITGLFYDTTNAMQAPTN
jgi:intein/homing endonuclease